MKKRRTRLGSYISTKNPRRGYDGIIKVPNLVLPAGAFPITRQGAMVVPKINCSLDSASLFVLRGGDDFVFVDTSIFDRETPKSFWDALIDRSNDIIAINSVRDELRHWIRNNPTNYAVKALNDRRLVLNYMKEFPDGNKVTYRYYVNLLVERKILLTRWWLAKKVHAHSEPSDADILSRQEEIQKAFGVRALGLAKKHFRKDLQSGFLEPTFYTDESLVYIAVVSAIRSGRNVTIFTKDEDIQEQLFKLHYLMHMHYASMNFATLYTADPLRYHSETIKVPGDEWSNILDDPVVTFIKRPDDNVNHYYPPRWQPVVVKCVNMGEKFFFSSFSFETGMRQILDLKEKTGGLNIDWRNGKNFHIWPFTLRCLSPFPLYSAITYDKRRQMPWPNLRIPELDYYHAWVDCERFKIVEYS